MSIAVYTLICTATLAVLAGADQSQYCNLKSCKGKPHTACIYKAGKTSPTCGKVIHAGVTEAQKNEILAAHNALRAKVASGAEKRGSPGPQPGSANIRSLQWSNELAAIAQVWANQCKNGHDDCHNIPAYKVGQNFAQWLTYGQASESLTSMIQDWYDEVQYVDRNIVSSFIPKDFKKIGHYTQMVWGTTTHVGCGFIVFNNSGPKITTNLVCNYGPAGNVLRQPMY